MVDQLPETRRRVALVPWPYQGHISPMLELGTALHSKGFSITIAHTNFNSPNPLNHPNLTFISIFERLTHSDTTLTDFIALTHIFNAKCESPLQQCLSKIMGRKGSGDELICVIYDALMYAGATVSNYLQLPHIIFHTVSHTALLANSSVLQLYNAGSLPMPDSKLQNLVPGIHPLRFKDLIVPSFGTLESFTNLLEISRKATKSSSAIIFNAIKDLENDSLTTLHQEFQVPLFSVGPLFKISPTSSSTSLIDEDNSCIQWLDKQAPNSVLYLSSGSIVSVDEKELAEMAWGLAQSDQPFLWVNRQNIELPKSFEAEVSERGFVVKWAPQKQVLAHKAIGGFWSHCGWNSTLESIAEGVPMLCSPCFGDQRINSRYVSSAWKIGLELDGALERGEIENAVRKLMADKEGEYMRKRGTLLKEQIDNCINKEGSSYRSLENLGQFICSL